MTRAWRAGYTLGMALVEMVHLMYQKQTAIRFLEGVCQAFDEEYDRRRKKK